MTRALKIDTSLRERRRIIRLLDFLKRDDLTGEQMERIGRRLQKSGKRALKPLVRKLWREQNGTAIYRYTCMLDFFDDVGWLEQLVKITLQRKDLEEDGKLALLDVLHDCGIDVTAPPFAAMTGYGASSLEGFIDECLADGERGLVRFIDSFIDVADEFREQMLRHLSATATPEAVALLEILLSFDKPAVVRGAILALGRMRHGYALTILERARDSHEGETAELIRRNMRRLSFNGIRIPVELPAPSAMPLPFHDIQASPVDFYGTRSVWFSWKLDDGAYSGMLLLTAESDGLLNAISYRMKDEKEYDQVLREVTSSEVLQPVEQTYALGILRDALHHSREQDSYLPPDFYVDRRLFPPDAIKPEAYIPRFSLAHLDGIIEKILGYVTSSNELLDDPNLDGWILSEPAVYDAADRLIALEAKQGGEIVKGEALETEISRFCEELITPNRANMVKRLLLTADYMQNTGSDDLQVQQTLATALSLVGGFLPENRHPFVRRLVLDSLDTARQALSEGYDLRLEEGYGDEDE
jgi:hypothetical protein